MNTTIKILLTGGMTVALLYSGQAWATSVREYQNMTQDQKVAFLFKETNALLANVKTYDPGIEAKTRHYMLEETNQYGVFVGTGAVLAIVDVAEKKHPETTDKIQMETITKVVIQNFWKSQNIVVPADVLGLKQAAPKQAAPATNN